MSEVHPEQLSTPHSDRMLHDIPEGWGRVATYVISEIFEPTDGSMSLADSYDAQYGPENWGLMPFERGGHANPDWAEVVINRHPTDIVRKTRTTGGTTLRLVVGRRADQ